MSKQRRPEGGSVRPPPSIFGKGMTLIPTGKRLRGSFSRSVFHIRAHAVWIKHGPIPRFDIRECVNLFMRSCQVAKEGSEFTIVNLRVSRSNKFDYAQDEILFLSIANRKRYINYVTTSS